MLTRSSTLCILTKATPSDDGLTNIAPVALSYDSEDWEAAAGDLLLLICSMANSSVNTQSDLKSIYLP